MFTNSRRNRHTPMDIWPGFVDALATLLMVIIFVLMAFLVAQLYLADALSGRDASLASMTQKMESLTQSLRDEKHEHRKYETKSKELEELLVVVNKQLTALGVDLSTEKLQTKQAAEHNESLQSQIALLSAQLKDLGDALTTSESKTKNQNEQIADLKTKLDTAVAEKLAELKQLKGAQTELESENAKNKATKRLGEYRSEFFSKLQKAVGNRSDMRVVGDRFVFQSEVLFAQSSPELEGEGKKKLDQLADALKEISQKIPTDLKWVLRIDGHTDKLPIHTSQFPSNWELSSARAISVVKYLIEKGVNPKNLVAAGFGEHQPLIEGGDTQELARNRRIEFKLDQR
ncbi:MAG: peptidoglycan-binding protein [Alphaproteobacteria bacterium]|nr:peptidoglycan-binding protein [Alphaproteobacteria bacterium]